MHPSSERGNNSELWVKLLTLLDEKLQLGLLDHLKRVSSYHFEDHELTIQPGSQELLAQDATKIEKVRLKAPETN